MLYRFRNLKIFILWNYFFIKGRKLLINLKLFKIKINCIYNAIEFQLRENINILFENKNK